VPRVVSVRLRHPGQFYDFDSADMPLNPGDWVIVETARGQDIGRVVLPPHEVPSEAVQGELKPVVRLAVQSDLRRMEHSQEREAEALARTREKVAEANLPMRLVAAEYTYSGRSLTVYFTAEKRVDFRELVKELAREFRARIELRQIGARDEARLLGGVGSCGRPLCCATWLQDFLRISVRMAKEQDLPLSPTKISGVCGRLLCCLSYECDQYREIKSCLPEVGEEVPTLRGRGKVVAISVPKETATVEVRAGVTVEATLEELARAAQLEEAGQLVVPRPACVPGFAERAEEPAALSFSPAQLEEADKHPRRRHRRKKKAEGAELAPPVQKAPAPQPQRRKGPPQRPPRREARPERPRETAPQEPVRPAGRSRRPRRRLPREGGQGR
jgi:cell fate regulator YaaT (PSP1 superfamily)